MRALHTSLKMCLTDPSVQAVRRLTPQKNRRIMNHSSEHRRLDMPRGDRRGPDGFGPMTGRGLGYCAGYETPGYMAPVPGRGGGYGYG
ncbi:MAG: DUF5320 domain-containing protein, partial [Spirochaetaceae bacterium]